MIVRKKLLELILKYMSILFCLIVAVRRFLVSWLRLESLCLYQMWTSYWMVCFECILLKLTNKY